MLGVWKIITSQELKGGFTSMVEIMDIVRNNYIYSINIFPQKQIKGNQIRREILVLMILELIRDYLFKMSIFNQYESQRYKFQR